MIIIFFLETMSQEWFLHFLIGEKQPKEKEYFVTQEKLHEMQISTPIKSHWNTAPPIHLCSV